MNIIQKSTWAVVLAGVSYGALAQNLPSLTKYSFADESYIERISDNGQWAIAQPSYSDKDRAPKLINLNTGAVTVILRDTTQLAYDVTDDALFIVGQSEGVAAVRTDFPGTMDWYPLPELLPSTLPTGWTSTGTQSKAVAVTPDGAFAVGSYYQNDGYLSVPALWDLTNFEAVSLSGLPTKDMAHLDQGQMTFNAISADGRYILGNMSYSYIPAGSDLGGCCYFIYDAKNKSYKMIGFKESDTQRWTPVVDGLEMLEATAMSPNGKYVTGSATVYSSSEDTEGGTYPFLYDVMNDKVTVYNAASDMEGTGYTVSNDGIVILSTPNSSPVREWHIRCGNYWYAIAEVYKQKFGTSFYAATNLDNTGTVNNISADGMTIAAYPDPYGSYVLKLDKPIGQICEGMTMLGSYTAVPSAGAAMSRISKLTITFPYPVKLAGSATSIMFQKADGTGSVNSIGVNVNQTSVSVTFRSSRTTMEKGKNYKIVIPEGTFVYEYDETQGNTEISIPYVGRADEAIEVANCYPVDGSSMIDFNNSTSYVQLTYSTDILLADSAKAYLYRNNETSPLTELVVDKKGNQVAIFPAYDMNFYKENTYTIVLAKGSVTDMGGNNPSERFSVTYQGGYERTVTSDDVNLFFDDFSTGVNNFLLYCGDLLQPTDEMVNLDFDLGLPWSVVLDDAADVASLSAASHSCYTPSGKSDDWMVTPQIFIPDAGCSLSFKSQSYRSDKKDYLKVIVWACEKQYNELTTAIVNRIKQEGKVVYNQLQKVGASENTLAGEWSETQIDLAEYAGQYIYICFVNENENQSVVFLDDVLVLHNMNYLVTFDNASAVVAQNEIKIEGKVIGYNDDKTYQNMTLTLKDEQGNTIDTFTATGLSLSKNQNTKFSFSKALPLSLGITNKFSIVCDLDGDKNEVTSSVQNLAFEPTRRVVIEEFTGMTCGNCPLGIYGIEKAEKQYGDRIVPISIHTYTGDPWANGQSSYSSFLGLSAAPSGRINRGVISYPAESQQLEGTVRYYFHQSESSDIASPLWLDYVDDILKTPASCDIDCHAVYNESTNAFDASVAVRYALNAEDVHANLFVVLMEDKLTGIQENYIASNETNDMGEWSKGKSLGQKTVSPVTHNDVVLAHWGATFNGTSNLFPSTVEAGKNYTTTLSVPVPAFAKVIDNCKLAALLIDPATGTVINATTSLLHDPSGINEVCSKVTNTNAIYTLSGVLVKSASHRGLYIANGRKIFIK